MKDCSTMFVSQRFKNLGRRRLVSARTGIDWKVKTVGFTRIVSYIDMPNTLSNIVRASARTTLCSVTTGNLIPCVRFEIPHPFRKQACGHKVEEASRHDKEDLK